MRSWDVASGPEYITESNRAIRAGVCNECSCDYTKRAPKQHLTQLMGVTSVIVLTAGLNCKLEPTRHRYDRLQLSLLQRFNSCIQVNTRAYCHVWAPSLLS
jgi:hypothetical protein